ncbi:MAG: hypothetical protein IJK24_08445, partial [Oscillospiraceae bacterium]|nr:hypothetical protein [Oscillospiraceae bacterium]
IILQSTKDVPMYLFIIPQKQQKSKDFFLAIPNFFHFLSLPKVANSGGMSRPGLRRGDCKSSGSVL